MTEHQHDNAFPLQSNQRNQRGLLIALSITALMTVAEAIGGIVSNSLALLGDAGHMLTDTLALGLSLFAFRLARRPPTPAKTYGYHRTEIIAALINGSTLVLVSFYIFYEAYLRFLNPPPVKTPLMLTVAIIGLIANLAGIWVLKESGRENLNVRGAFLHILGDTLSSVGVIIGGIIIFFTDWYVIDPLIGVLIGGIILRGAVGLVTESGNILLEGVPRHINIEKVASEVKNTRGVRDIHDLHVWAITSGIYALSGHLLIDDQMVSKSSDILAEVNYLLSERFGIGHTTLQLECESCVNGLVCRLENTLKIKNRHPDKSSRYRRVDL